MAEQVTGTIGNETVTLNNAASEATLEKLLEAIDKSSKKSDQQKKQDRAAFNDFYNRLRDGSATLGDFAKATGNAAKAAASSVGRGFSNVGDAATGLASEFATGSARISDFSSHIAGLINQIPFIGGVLGAPLQLFASFVDNNVDTFRQLSTVGIDFGNSIFSAQEAATRSRLSLDTFASVVSQNSVVLAQLEGSASSGARAFRDVSNRVQRDFIPRFSSLGLTMEETAEFTGDFLAVQTRLGRAQQMSNNRLATQTQDYIMELDRLARVTGIQRDQLSDMIKQESADARFQALLSTMDEQAQRVLTASVAQIEQNAGPQAAESFRNMIASFGQPIDDVGRSLALISDGAIPNLARRLGSANITFAESQRLMQAAGVSASNQSDQLKILSGATAAQGNQSLAAIGMLQGLVNVGGELTEAEQDQRDAIQNGGRAFLSFESSIVQLRNAVLGNLIRSDVFTNLQESFNDLLSYITENGLPKLEGAIETFSTYFDGLFEKLRTQPDYTLGDMIAELGVAALQKLTPLFVELTKVGIKAIGIAIKEMFSNPLVTAAIIGFFVSKAAISAAVFGIKSLFLASVVTNAAAGGVSGLFGTMKSMLGPGIVKLFKNLGKGLGIGALLGLPGMALSSIGDSQVEAGRTELGQGLNVAGGALQGAGLGATIGSFGGPAGMAIGAGIGAVAGGFYSMYQNRDGSSSDSTQPNSSTSQQELQSAQRAQAASTVTDAQLERLDKLIGFAPKVDNLSRSVGGFQETFNQLDLNYREIDRTTRSLERMTDQLEEINTQLAGGEQGFFDRIAGNNNQTTAGDVITGANNSNQNQLADLNRVMKDILGVLLSANDMERKHLTATRRLTGNVY
jgi:hypothetical protein